MQTGKTDQTAYKQSDLELHCLLSPFWQVTTPAVKFLELIFRNNFLIFNFSKMCCDESCRGEYPPTSPKGLVLVGQTDFCVYR